MNQPPLDRAAFLRTLRRCHTEEQLFSRLTFACLAQYDEAQRPELLDDVRGAAYSLRLPAVEYKTDQWLHRCQDAIDTDRDAFLAAANAEARRANDKMRAEQTPVGPGVLADVPLQNVDWLVPDLLPRGELSLLGADGGTGKGLWQAQLIACVTTGKTSGFFPVPPAQTGKVLILAGEDDPGKVLKARLLAAGADMNRVLCLTADDYFQRTGQPLTLKDEALAKFAAKAGPLLLIVDPLQSFLPAGVEMASRNQMRSILLPLKAIAAAQRCAVLLVMHSNKKMGVSGRARLADSSDIWDMARSVLMMGRSNSDGKIYLSHEKSSYSRPQQTVLLHIEDVELDGVRTAQAVFDGYTDKKDADFIKEPRVRQAQTKEDTRDAILNVLAESRLGSMASPQLKSEVMREIGNWPEVEVTAIVCRPQSAEKAHAWAAEYGVPAVYTDEAAAYAVGGFDAVYIGTANHLHYAAAKRALQAGYHVLLEKPFTATAAEARELFALADAKGLVLMEAITIPYLPQYAFLQAELPKIGEVRGAMASFCARSARYDDYLKGIWNTTFDPACLGGALNDMNVYNLHLLCGLLGVPGRAEYRPSCGPNGIDTAGLALLDYGGFTAAALAAKDSEGRNGMVLQGPGGYLVVEGGTNALPVVYSVLGGVRGGGTRVDGPKPERHRMAYEFAEFARIIAEKDADAEAAARMRTMRVMELLDVLHEK